MIVETHGGLYLLEPGPLSLYKKKNWSSISSKQYSCIRQLLQWHRRLRHPSFVLMQRLFPSFFRQYNNHDLACDACEFAKYRRFSYPSSLNKRTAPFIIIHSHVWGPSRDLSISGYRWLATFFACFLPSDMGLFIVPK